MTRVLTLLLAAVLLVACGNSGSPDEAGELELTQIEQVRVDCRLPSATVGDEGTTLVVDQKGEADSDGLSFDQVVCVLSGLDVSDAVVARLDSTRAMDGVQSGEWDDYTATWSYHPDSGLELIVEAERGTP